MEVKHMTFGGLIIGATVLLVLIWKTMKFIWLRPKYIEKCLRKQGLKGNSYKLVFGDIMELVNRTKQALLKPINFNDDPLPRIHSFLHHTIQTYGKNCFAWAGPMPWLIISDPDKIKEMLTNYEECRKPDGPINRLLMVGLFSKEGHAWAKHRKIINPAFHFDKLKNVCHTMYESCSVMIDAWEEIFSSKNEEQGSIELDVFPFLENLSGDFISRAAFGSNYQHGKRIFDLQTEYIKLTFLNMLSNYIPGWRHLPTKKNKRVKEIGIEVKETLTKMIETRKAEMERGSTRDDLLGMLLESNMRENEGQNGLTTKEVVEECQLFYLAGSETTSALLVWSLILLSKHPIWQERARTEVLQTFGIDGPPNFDGLSRLKIIPMILNEVLRLYPPAFILMRKVYEDMQLKELFIPEGTEIIIPLCMIHRDSSLWGEDAAEFNPERFAGGVSEATKGQLIYFPFGFGPRICIGKNFALLEAKLVLSMVLQRYSLDLSPSYAHAPYSVVTTKPQHGANLILTKLDS